jgi:hypothetical protein
LAGKTIVEDQEEYSKVGSLSLGCNVRNIICAHKELLPLKIGSLPPFKLVIEKIFDDRQQKSCSRDG